MQPVEIRAATHEDYERLLDLYGRFVEDDVRFTSKDNDSFSKIIEQPHTHMDVAVIDGKVVGFIMYSSRTVFRYPRPIVEVEEFYVFDDHRRKGIGRALMDRVLSYAKSIRSSRIFLASAKERTGAHAFYKAYGFEEYGYHYLMKLDSDSTLT
ncbi:MAG: GNAT family N-acetyltransferase [Nanoarchaeota archaeon]